MPAAGSIFLFLVPNCSFLLVWGALCGSTAPQGLVPGVLILLRYVLGAPHPMLERNTD